jgi:hypothetical protein
MKVMEIRFEGLTDLPEEFAGTCPAGPPSTFSNPPALPAPPAQHHDTQQASSSASSLADAFALPARPPPPPLQLGMPQGIHAAAEVLPGLSADDVNAMLGINAG